MITEKAESEVSDNESEVDRQAEHEEAFKKSGSPTQFRINGINETTLIRKARIVVYEEDRRDPNIPAELLKYHHIVGH